LKAHYLILQLGVQTHLKMRKYVIVNTSILDELAFNELKTTSKDTVRKNVNGTKAIVSYEGTTPSGLSEETEYTNDQLRAIVDDVNGEWYIESEE